MLDKHELQELLVRLKLGTLSVESAIEEIESEYTDEAIDRAPELWRVIDPGFDEVIFAKNMGISAVAAKIESMISKRLRFVIMSLDEDKMSSLAKKYQSLEYNYDACMVASVREKKSKKSFAIHIITSGSSSDELKVAHELEFLSRIAGAEVVIHKDMKRVALLNPNMLKNKIKNADILIVTVPTDTAIVSLASSLSTLPLIAVPIASDNDHYAVSALTMLSSNMNGIVFVGLSRSFDAFMASLRILNGR